MVSTSIEQRGSRLDTERRRAGRSAAWVEVMFLELYRFIERRLSTSECHQHLSPASHQMLAVGQDGESNVENTSVVCIDRPHYIFLGKRQASDKPTGVLCREKRSVPYPRVVVLGPIANFIALSLELRPFLRLRRHVSSSVGMLVGHNLTFLL
jgi:hypothetical protein